MASGGADAGRTKETELCGVLVLPAYSDLKLHAVWWEGPNSHHRIDHLFRRTPGWKLSTDAWLEIKGACMMRIVRAPLSEVAANFATEFVRPRIPVVLSGAAESWLTGGGDRSINHRFVTLTNYIYI